MRHVVLPGVKRLPKPLIGPHGLRGMWRLENTPVANLSLTTTFYTQGREVMHQSATDSNKLWRRLVSNVQTVIRQARDDSGFFSV